MQVPSQNKLEIVSPNCAKSISFNFNNKESKPPLQLISWHEKKGFVVNPEAHKFFDTLRDNNLGIVTIVGKNRTGKSYLLNRVVLNQNSGFSVGHTVNPCTKGIWVWPHVIEIENKNNESEKLNVIVLDTEGTDATDQHENYDTKVFMLGMLLSSYFIYNSVGAIDEKAIQNLSLIINLSKHLQKTNEKEFEDLMECFPSFLWVVRDFALKLIDTQGNPITSKEYLENALKPQKGISEAIEAKNRIRRLLSNFFKDRDCFMMVRPTESENDMQSLHQLKPESLRPEFNEQVNTLRRKIWIKVKPKLFRGKPINGPGFLVLCKLLCNMLNSEETLSLENSWNSICRIECEKIVRDISEEYDQQMKAELEKAVINEHTMGNLHKKKKSEALENFKKRAMGDKVKNFEEVLNETLKQRFKSLKNMFYSKIESRMKETVEERLEGFEKKIQNREFATFTDLVIEFKSIKVELEQEYKSPESHEALLEYLFQSFFRASETFYDDIETSRKQNERLRQADLEGFESKLAYIEKHHQEKMQESTDNYRQLETEKMKLRSHIASLEDKIKEIENERSNESVLIDQKVQEIIKEHQAKEANLKTQLKELSTQLQQLKHEKEELVEDKEALMAEAESKLVQKLEEAKKEKQELAMKNEEIIRDQEHEVEYKEEQIESLNYTISGLKKELEQERHSHKASIHAMEEIKKMMTVSPMKTSRRKDQMEDGCRCRLMDEVLKENKDLKRNIDILNARMESNVDEFYLQRNDLENKLKEIERHYREKQLQDEFALSTLKKRIKTYENADMAMAETNKNLSLTLERADTRCFNLEKKVVKLKKYHKIFKHADEISCKFCGKMVKKTLFMAHFEICNLNDDRNYDECSLYQHPSLNITLDKHGHHTLANRAFKIEGQLGRQRCSVTKSFQDVHHLIYAIKDQVKHSEILPYLEELLKVNEERLSEENWAKTKELLNDVLSSLAKMPQVRDSQAFRDFLPMREPSENLTSTYSHSPEESSFPSSRGRENRIIFDATEQHPKKSSHSRKASHRYYDEKESYINHVLGDKGKRAITINPDIGPKEPAFYESFDT